MLTTGACRGGCAAVLASGALGGGGVGVLRLMSSGEALARLGSGDALPRVVCGEAVRRGCGDALPRADGDTADTRDDDTPAREETCGGWDGAVVREVVRVGVWTGVLRGREERGAEGAVEGERLLRGTTTLLPPRLGCGATAPVRTVEQNPRLGLG